MMKNNNESKLTKSQFKTYKKTGVHSKKHGCLIDITVNIRFDDECNNGHNSFAMTADIYEAGKLDDASSICFGMCHDDIKEHFPELEKYLKWHLCATDGPLYYIENTMYHVHEAVKCALANVTTSEKERAISKDVLSEAVKPFLQPARNTAIWQDAELGDFTETNLTARLPSLLNDFRAAVEELGFTW